MLSMLMAIATEIAVNSIPSMLDMAMTMLNEDEGYDENGEDKNRKW